MLFREPESQPPIANVVGRDPSLSWRLLIFILFATAMMLYWQWSYETLKAIPNMSYSARIHSSPLLVWEELQYLLRHRVLDGVFSEHLFASLQRVAVGLVVGTCIGFPLGAAMVVFSRHLRFVGLASLFILMGISKISVLYIMSLWFDSNETAKYAIGIWATMLYQMALSYEGASTIVYGTTREHRELMRDLSLFAPSRWFLYRRIVLPLIRGRLFLGLLLVNPVCWLMLILAEAYSPLVGLGVIVYDANLKVNADRIMAGTVLLALCVFATSAIIWALRSIFVRR